MPNYQWFMRAILRGGFYEKSVPFLGRFYWRKVARKMGEFLREKWVSFLG